MRSEYNSIHMCLQDYRDTISLTKSLKITFDNILSDQDHAEQFKYRINQTMLFPKCFDTGFFQKGDCESGIRILSLLGFTRLNNEGIFDYNVNELRSINKRNEDSEKFVDTETRYFADKAKYTSPLLSRRTLMDIVEHDYRTCDLFGDYFHDFSLAFMTPEAEGFVIDNMSLLMIMDYGLDCLMNNRTFSMPEVISKIHDHNRKVKDEDISKIFEFYFVNENAPFGKYNFVRKN